MVICMEEAGALSTALLLMVYTVSIGLEDLMLGAMGRAQFLVLISVSSTL